jgi:Cytoskeletal adhesion/PH domain/Ankyrin repeats (3 copies)
LLMAGYLKKRRETDRWIRRWCVLTETSLLYFHKKSDTEPSKVIKLDSAMLKKSEHVDFAFELHTPDLLDKKNKEGRLYFQAADEETLQTWMVPLHMVVGLYQFRHDKRREPMEFLDLEGRAALVQLSNKAGETPLHMAARMTEVLTPGKPAPAAVQQVAAWLVENGANPNAADTQGQTPLHVAVTSGNVDTAAGLAKKGGNLSAKRSVDGKTVVELAQTEAAVSKLMVEYFHPAERSPLLPPPEKLFGFTYLSFLLEKTTMSSTAELTSPFIAVSVYNAKGQLTEAQQDLVLPSLTRPNYLWWAHTWHMQTPLETLGPNSVVIFELRDQGETRKPRTLAWGAYRLDIDDMNTRTETLNMYAAPVDPSLKKLDMAEVILQGEAFLSKGMKASTSPLGAAGGGFTPSHAASIAG